MSLFNELKRRNVIRVGIAYVVAAWLLLQAIDFALDVIGAPNWIMQVLVMLGVAGLPVVLAFAWVFEMTPEGIKRESEIQQDASVTAHTAKKLDKLTIALLIAVVVFVTVDRFIPEMGSESNSPDPGAQASLVTEENLTLTPGTALPIAAKATPGKPSLAVLPFANMSADPDNEYFSEGMSEELLNLLVQVKGLRVPSRTSSFAFKGKNMDIKEIARQLNVSHVLEGSVRKSGNQVRITAQLIDVTTDTHMWSKTYDRELKNIFAIQDEIATEIVREMKIALNTSGLKSREASQPTKNMQAYQDYLRGRHLFIQRGIPSLKASIKAMQSAAARDPDFTEAWAGLSMTAAVLSGWDPDNANAYNQLALEAGTHALELDKNSATALAGLGLLNYNEGKWTESLELLKRASELSKDSSPTYFYGLVLQSTGYIKRALEMFQAAEILDPVYPQLQYYLGVNAMLQNDTAAAKLYFQRTVDGGNANGVRGMYWLNLKLGELEKAIEFLQQNTAQVVAGLATGPVQASTDIISAALRDPSRRQAGIKAAVTEGDLFALGHFSAGPETIELLNTQLNGGKTVRLSVSMALLWAPDFSSLRQMPEFKQLLTDTGLVELWKQRGWPDLCQPLGEDDFQCDM